VDWNSLVAGDPAAALVLVGSLAGRLEQYAALRAADLSQADREDAVERALAKVVRNIDKYDPAKGTFLTWARVLVRRELAETRRAPRPISVDPAVLAEHLGDRSTGPDPTGDAAVDAVDPYDPDIAVDPKHVAITALLLQLLGDSDTALVRAHVHEGLTFPQIAEQLGPPANAANLRQRYARIRRRVIDAARQDPDLKHLTQENQ
jgi:RNA polymerase sigma factor (sigma-70 family)